MFGYGFKLGIVNGLISSIGKTLAKAYKTRVEADGGTYENDDCLVSKLNGLSFEPTPLLLDQYAGSSAAYSLRNLSVDTNNVIRARRSSDNAELDFTSIQITDGTLTTWTGSGDGFVAIWYDQSVNNKDISSSTAAQQPKIVSSGSVLMDNGSPYILYDGNGSTGLLNSSSGLSNTNGSIFATYNSDSLVSGNLLVGVNGSSYIGIMSDGSISIPDQGSGVPSYYKNGSLISRTRDSLYDNYVINEDVLITVLNCSFDDGDWGTIRPYIYAANSFSAVVKAKEFIIYDSDQTTNAADIEGNINDNYSIY